MVVPVRVRLIAAIKEDNYIGEISSEIKILAT